MRKSIGVILYICLLIAMILGCGSVESNLTEDDYTAVIEENCEPEMADTTESEVEQLDWKQAYLEKAEELAAEEYFLKYDLIYLDDDDIPELVAGTLDHMFLRYAKCRGFYLYTWKDGEVCKVMICRGDSSGVYRYNPYQGMIVRDWPNFNQIVSGIYATNYTKYYKVTEDMEIIEQYGLIEQCREEGSTYFYKEASGAVEITEEAYSSYLKGDWLKIEGRYDLETFRGLLEKTEDLWKQEEWLWEGLDQKTLEFVSYTNADGDTLYITEEESLQKISVLLGGLHGVACGRPRMDNYRRISFYTTDEMWGHFIYKGNFLYRDGSGAYKMQDDIEEVLSDLDYFTSTDYMLSQVESEKGRETIREILEEEGSRLAHLVVNRLENLNYCLFETSVGKGREFHLFLWGSWEGKAVQQYQAFPLNDEEYFPLDELSERCEVTKEDIDFDGKPDLLIYEGYNGGSGGSWEHYRVMRWDDAQGQFVYYPSFPFSITFWNLENKQVIYEARVGDGDYTVRIYGIVDGEYCAIQEIHIDFWAEMISYYENGALVRKYDVTGMGWDEMKELFRQEGLSEIFSYI